MRPPLMRSSPYSTKADTRSPFAAWILAVACAFNAVPTLAQSNPCGELYTDHYGPFDFRTIPPASKSVVERNHFTPNVENLIKGENGWLGGDISYTLKAIPNHPRALAAMAKLARVERKPTPRGAAFSVDCWFERAIRFQPNDQTVRLVYAIELMRDKKPTEAIEQLRIGEQLAPDDANIHYNLGLAYFEVRDFDLSLKHARQAYDLGFPLPGLREKLRRQGAWKD